MAHLITTLGPMRRDELGMILPHEHVFVDLRTWDQPGYGEAEAEDVVRLMGPEVARARDVGVTAIVEPSTVGVGRRADILRAFSEATGFPLVAPTGVYREPWMPPWVHGAADGELRDWMVGELTGEIEQSGVQAGWIKVGASDDGLTECETKVLRAAGAASAATGATVGSHTIRGRVARAQLDVLEVAGTAPGRFVWVHAHQEPDVAMHHELARRGAWIEYDGIGDPGSDERFIDLVLRALNAGLGNRLLLSHDRGWYDPAQPGGGTPRPFTYLSEHFLPLLRAAGVDDVTIRQVTVDNPFDAFARAA
ncbi:MAG: phosphotriesterase family protein [Thermomicrobiales bacterium]